MENSSVKSITKQEVIMVEENYQKTQSI